MGTTKLESVLVAKSVLYDNQLTPSEKIVYFMLYDDIQQNNGKSIISDIKLAELINRTKQRAYQLIWNLKDADLIDVKFEDYKNRVITLKK